MRRGVKRVIYQLKDGGTVDTDRDLSFEERNFIQKMMIFSYLKMGRQEFRRRWQKPDTPVWKGPETLHRPGPAVQILLDLEAGLEDKTENGPRD